MDFFDEDDDDDYFGELFQMAGEKRNQWHDFLAKNKDEMGLITTWFQTQTESAKYLCIQSLSEMLSQGIDFNIGNTYKGDKLEFCFYGSTSVCHGYNFLLKLFVSTCKDARFSVYIPTYQNYPKDQIEINNDIYAEVAGPPKEFIFASAKNDEIIYMITYNFTREDLTKIGRRPLLLPCSIEVHTKFKILPAIVNRIKLQETVALNEALYKSRSQGDFIIESSSKTRYPMHLYVAATHSPVLKEAIKLNNKLCILNLDDEEVETLIMFLYKGTIENVSSANACKIFELGDKMGLPEMIHFGGLALGHDINIDNAVGIAVLAKRYNLDSLLTKVFHYIQQNPTILFTKDIDSLNDADLLRSMLRYIGMCCFCEKKKQSVKIQDNTEN